MKAKFDISLGLDEDESVEVVVGKLLKEKGLTIATAESCTGGKIAQLFTSVEGAVTETTKLLNIKLGLIV